VILKKATSDGGVSVLTGGYFDGGGATHQVDLDAGVAFAFGLPGAEILPNVPLNFLS
jgi:hypothetical protein